MADKKLTREEAQELYDDLSKAMNQMMAKRNGPQRAGQAATKIGSIRPQKAPSVAKSSPSAVASSYASNASTRSAATTPLQSAMTSTSSGSQTRGHIGAIALVALFCVAKIAVSALEAVGVGEVQPAQASVVALPSGPQWSKEETKVLTSLDHRRAELEERASRLEQREHEFVARDRDLAVRLTELKELTERLKIEREKGDKQRGSQLEQLANVYGSMNPPEAAHLLEQLDIQIALSLIQRMPEKRIGQILSLMNAERALELTNRLSSRSAK